MAVPSTVLPKYLRARLAVLGWSPAEFHRALAAAGLHLTIQAVCLWLHPGGGIRDRHRPIVARVLGVELGELALAAAGVEPPTTLPDTLALTG